MASKITVLGVALVALAGMGTSWAGERKILKVHQDPPALVQLDLGANGPSHGDVAAFDAKVRDEAGRMGTLHGLLVTVEPAASEEHRFGQLFFDFGNGNGIVVAGKRLFPRGQREISSGKEQLYAIIGGTGDFIGARGQLSSVRNADGSYDHLFTLLD